MCESNDSKRHSAVAVRFEDERKLARWSYGVDSAVFLANVVFLASWAASVARHREQDDYTRIFPWDFDSSFLKNGFCASPMTHLTCTALDAIVAALVAVAFCYKAKAGQDLSLEYGTIGYLLAHAHGHYIAHGQGENPQDIQWGADLFVLMAILAMGPAYVYQAAHTKLGTKITGGICVIWEIVLVSIYFFGLKKVSYSLAYINLAIYISAVGARLIFLPPDDVEGRMKAFGPYVRTKLILFCLLMTVTWIEPTSCDSWFRSVGGHFWFDATLAASSVVEIVCQRELRKSKSAETTGAETKEKDQ